MAKSEYVIKIVAYYLVDIDFGVIYYIIVFYRVVNRALEFYYISLNKV